MLGWLIQRIRVNPSKTFRFDRGKKARPKDTFPKTLSGPRAHHKSLANKGYLNCSLASDRKDW